MTRLREIPSVTEVLDACHSQDWAAAYSREYLLDIIREELSGIRSRVKSGSDEKIDSSHLIQAVKLRMAQRQSFSLKKVINATGIIVHTNLGRAPIADEAIRHMNEIAAGYSNLEFNLHEGRRGSRDMHFDCIASPLFGAEATIVVNNNAAALLLILNTLAEGKEVIVSRGELVEIGGSFRLPEIMKKSGAILKETGTTNKTRITDYRSAISERTGMILLVHPSNFQIIGFTEKPAISELVSLASEFKLPLVEDHGSGIAQNLETFGISSEPQAQERLQEGIEVLCFSGDKILGGPQAGIVCGKKELIERMRKNSLFRALRVDKLIYAALEATLLLHRQNPARVPVLRMLNIEAAELSKHAEAWAAELRSALPDCAVSVEPTTSYIGGGVAPMKGVPSCAVSVSSDRIPASQLALKLREAEIPIVARIEEDRVFFDLRTLQDGESRLIGETLTKILSF